MHVTRLTTAVFGALLALSIGLVAQAQTQVLELDGGLQVPITTQTPNGLRARPGVVGPAVPAVPAEAVAEVTEEVVEGVEEDAEDRSIGASDTLLIEYQPLGEDEIDDTREVLLERIFGNRIFKVDAQGVLRLPILGAIPLGGLTAPRAAQRLQSEGPLRDVEVSVTVLPLAPIGADAVEGFGYDVFGASAAGAFQPSIDVPVPSSYVVGPGDIVELHLFGEKTMSYVLEISREGVLNIPEIGPLSVTAMTFQQLKDDVKERVQKQFIGVSAYITLGTLRAFQIFIIGEVIVPGAYTVSALSTITSALIQSGGIKPTGSLRNVQLKRGDRVVARLDLYDLLLSGDKSADRRLSANDVIFVPTIGTTVKVAGEVRRPATYELKGGERLQTLVELAGGLNPNARLGEAQLERVA